ncbi:uncharacterized protein LOC111344666 [Stylophora pistillata]|uniref:uncharacterized protein LOC111344666 n=1 Tax=Stylophora pistillata TaxID=50429 RepID=UPI000C0413C3|nr:uncharacterized protein LOC111344666 [Stylophora pistillata]
MNFCKRKESCYTPARNEGSTRGSAGDDIWLPAEDTLENNQGSIERGEDFEMLPAEDSSAMKLLEWCQNQLRAFYKTICQVKITPWDPDNTESQLEGTVIEISIHMTIVYMYGEIVYFLHKSVQEFLAARFVVEELTVKKNGTVTCLSGMDTFEKSRKMAEVLKFACELSLKAAGILFDHLHDVGEKEGLTSYQFTKAPSNYDLSLEQQRFIILCVDCLFLCPASDRTAVYSAFLSCVNHVVILTGKNTSTAAVEHFFKSVSSFPNYLFFLQRRLIQHLPDDVLSIMLDLNAVVLTSSGESKDVQKYADLLVGNSFLKKSGGRNFVDLIDITDEDFHSELLPELILALVCSSQPPLNNLVNNENNNIDVPLTENHCLSLVPKIKFDIETVEDAVLLKNVLPLVTAPRKIRIRTLWEEEEEAFDQLIESAINGINFTDNLHKLQFFDINTAAKCKAFISDSLQHSPNLRKLDLCFIPLHRGVSHLAENLHHVPQLTKLVLGSVQMGEKECAALAASLKYLNKLEELDIRDNALGHGVIELAKSLNNVPNLTELDLRNTNMGEDEASALAHALKYVPLLRYLNLTYNPLGRGVRDLVQHLSSVPELPILYLKGVQMTKTEFEELSTAVNERNVYLDTDYHAELKETEVRFRDESDGDNDDDDDDESTLGKKEEELLGAKEKTMEEVSEEKESLETKGSMTEVKIRQDVEASSTMEIPQAESSTRMKSLLYAESEELVSTDCVRPFF